MTVMSCCQSVSAKGRPVKRGFAASVRRAARTLGIAAVVVGSLLTFPSAIPWMVAVWLLGHGWFVFRGRPGWLPLAGCAVVLLVKRIPWPPAVIALGIVMLAAGLLDVIRMRKGFTARRRRSAWIGLLALWIAWAFMAIDWHRGAHSARPLALHPTRPVVCLGDSLTAGVAPYGGYPKDLQELITVPVVNLGQAGISTSDALEQLPALAEAGPQIVVVELGGHDYLKGRSRAATKANLQRIIEASRRIGAEVVLMEIPRAFISDPYAGMERELAREHDLELVPDTPIRRLVLGSPVAVPGMWMGPSSHLSDDGLHPNARGNRVLAQGVAEALARLAGPEILVDRE
jgi:acyl-CoA thioesterase-1